MDHMEEEATDIRKAHLNFDIGQVNANGIKGVNRAAAFLGMGLFPTRQAPPKSVSIEGGINWRFLPDPLPDPLANQIASEYKVWLIGNALRELDLHFSLYLDEVWRVAQWGSLHGKQVKSDHRIEEIDGDTNAAKKLARILEVFGDKKPDTEQLWSLSNARNCLSHNAGIVSERYAKPEGKLKLAWMAFDVELIQGDNVVTVTRENLPLHVPDTTSKAEIRATFRAHERLFEIGQRIDLNEHELTEICGFYHLTVTQTSKKLQDYLVSLGIVVVPKENPTHPSETA